MTTNIIPFPQKTEQEIAPTQIFEGFQLGKKQLSSNGIPYSFQDQLRASASPDAIINHFRSLVEYHLIPSGETHGFPYFSELLDTLSYSVYKNDFILPETTLAYISQQVGELNIFECKNILLQIDRKLILFKDTPQLYSTYNYIHSLIFRRFEVLRKSSKEK